MTFIKKRKDEKGSTNVCYLHNQIGWIRALANLKIKLQLRTYMTKFTDEHGQQHLMNERNKLCVQWMKKRNGAGRMMKLNCIVRYGSTYTRDGIGIRRKGLKSQINGAVCWDDYLILVCQFL